MFLAQHVGPLGKVYGFDVQAQALINTRQRLQQAGVEERVRLFHTGHEHMATALAGAGIEVVQAFMFNLGYLPGSDKCLITRPETTLPALDAAFGLLAPGGILTTVVYPGHEGGQHEADAVLDWAQAIPPVVAQVLWYHFINTHTPPPSLLAIEKRAAKEASL